MIPNRTKWRRSSPLSSEGKARPVVRLHPTESRWECQHRDRNPTWQPSGESILLTENRLIDDSRSLNFLLRYDLETGELAELSGDADLDDKLASWSPDGEWIAVVRGDVNERGISQGDNVWLMRPDGTDAYPLTSEPNIIYGEPVWSPDGKQLLLRFEEPGALQSKFFDPRIKLRLVFPRALERLQSERVKLGFYVYYVSGYFVFDVTVNVTVVPIADLIQFIIDGVQF